MGNEETDRWDEWMQRIEERRLFFCCFLQPPCASLTSFAPGQPPINRQRKMMSSNNNDHSNQQNKKGRRRKNCSKTPPPLPLAKFRISAAAVVALLVLVVCTELQVVLGQCPRKMGSSVPPSGVDTKTLKKAEAQPGLRPPKQFVQTTFVHRDLHDLDREYAQFLKLKLAELRPRLAREAALSLDNENLDCGGGGGTAEEAAGSGPRWEEHRCREYPLDTAFHFLVVEDSRTGAAVYSLPRAHNWAAEGRDATLGRLEMALLDALSRHSIHPLIDFASQSARSQLGFVRQLDTAELGQMIRQNEKELMKRSKGSSKSSAGGRHSAILIRSPFELRLLNERILGRRRSLTVSSSDAEVAVLLHFQGPELAEMIEESTPETALFVLFWAENHAVGRHGLHLWAAAARLWRQTEQTANANVDAGQPKAPVLFGAVECGQEAELCRAFGAHPLASGHLLTGFRGGHRLGQQLALGDPQFLLDWVRLLLEGPLIQLQSHDHVAKAREGILPNFEGPRPALTLGRFRDEQQEEFRHFRRAATLLAGRYNFAYLLDPSLDLPRLSTFRRPMAAGELQLEEVVYRGQFDTQSLLQHITHASVPEILDIGRGFTTELVLHADPTLLLVHDSSSQQPGNSQLRNQFLRLGRRLRTQRLAMEFGQLLELDRAGALPLAGLKALLALEEEEEKWPALCTLSMHEIRCALAVDAQQLAEGGELADSAEHFMRALEDDAKAKEDGKGPAAEEKEEEVNGKAPPVAQWTTHFPHRVSLDLTTHPHPLAQLQLEQINAIFGRENIDLEPEPIARRTKHAHNFAKEFDSTAAATSGCPMMAHLDKLRDEL